MYPILGFIGDFTIRAYWFFVSLGALAGFVILYFNTKTFEKQKKQNTLFFAFLIFIPFFLGSRIGYIVENPLMCSSGISFFGGTSLWWGLIIATISAFPIAKILKVNIWETADLFSMPIAIGGFFTRIGCLANGCCFGVPSGDNYFFGTFFSIYSQAHHTYGDTLLHPTQLYSSISWLAIFIFLHYYRKRPHFNGELILIMSILYGVFRFFIEFLRHHEISTLLSPAQYWSIAIIILSTFLFIFAKKSLKNTQKHNRNLTK